MTNTTIVTMEKPHLSVKVQTMAVITAIVAAVAVPQLFHVFGAVSGLGTSLGEAFLPMHLPIILAGLLAGPFAGAISGFFAPVISFGLSGMPVAAILPFMMIELCVYGLSAGILRNVKMPTIAKVLIVQFAGRAVRAAAILAAVCVFGNESVGIGVIWMSIRTGIFGLFLQWLLLPLIVYRVENLKRNEE